MQLLPLSLNIRRFSWGRLPGRVVLFIFLNLISLTAVGHTAGGQQQPVLPAIDRTRLAEAFRLSERLADRLWPGWSKTSFAVLLVTLEHEFLIRHPQPSADFNHLGYDPVLKSSVYYRKRTFPTNFLATFPPIRTSPISTVVVGQAQNTSAKRSTEWVLTVLHEHFHQWQESQPRYYADVAALNLAGGDNTGMWMLNYRFPYESSEVQEQFDLMSNLLAAALSASAATRLKRVQAYLAARTKFQSLITSDDDKYFAFQLWKEGTARYTECKLARLAAAAYRPSKQFNALDDFKPFAKVAKVLCTDISRQLTTQKLGVSKREVVYAFGAAEALLLDAINPHWRKRYQAQRFDLRKLFPAPYALR